VGVLTVVTIKNPDLFDLYYNGACNCISKNQTRKTTSNVLIDHINNHKNWMNCLASMICCGIFLFPVSGH